MRPRISALLLALVTALGVAPARADENGPPGLWTSPTAPASAAPRERRFYGWQLIPVDLASVALMALGSGNARNAGVGVYLASGLLIHTWNGNSDHGARSFVTRSGLPVLGWAVGGVLGGLGGGSECLEEECENDWPGLDLFNEETAAGGVVAGVALALAIDWIQLSWKDASASTERSSLAPQVTVGEQGLSLRVLGRF